MTTQAAKPLSKETMTLLSRLLLVPQGAAANPSKMNELKTELLNMDKASFDQLVELAHLNHVIIRGMNTFLSVMREAGDETRAAWAEAELATESARISLAVKFLHGICVAIEEEGHAVSVIKSLDHLPDLGSDLDLYTDADHNEIAKVMKKHFGAEMAARSWGDRLARKWNFELPGLPESVEIHMGRLGQTGEQVKIASRIIKCSRVITVEGLQFRVTSASDRIMISVLQRMYRHFYFRLCDVVDSAGLAESGGIDYQDLRAAALEAGIWEGTATYMVIVSDYVKSYRGFGIDLPKFVTDAAKFGGSDIYFAKDFLRVPIMPQSAKLYTKQLAGMVQRRELHSGARLSLLPWLATAALVGQKLTGSDKGIW
jgi:hypothetical protein